MRKAEYSRKTKETDISVSLCLEGGEVEVSTGIGFFDHMLTALFFYAGFGAKLTVTGDLHVDGHHTVEDTGIAIGLAFKEALGDKAGITRFASEYVPMDEALCLSVLDISGRPFNVFEADMPQEIIGGYDSCLTREFMRAFAASAAVTLHQRMIWGENSHHITEALYKSLGLCLKKAVSISSSGVVSTKGVLG